MRTHDKYYIPDITEFKQGLKYEWKSKFDKDWNKAIYELNLNSFDYGSGDIPASYVFSNMNEVDTEIQIRVKYLDEQDILDLGFSYSGYNDAGKSYFKEVGKERVYIRQYHEDCTRIHITIGVIRTRFYGKIKNKSELNEILEKIV